jgi:hypothetical protein
MTVSTSPKSPLPLVRKTIASLVLGVPPLLVWITLSPVTTSLW